jgi:hypothetical protein
MPKITTFADLTAATILSGDIVPLIDISDTTMSGGGTNKKITALELANGLASFVTTIPSGITTALDLKANIASPTFTGTVTAPAFTGVATLAAAWQTSRTLTLSGDVAGVVSGINGAGNISLSTALSDSAVTAAKLASNAVTTIKITDLNVTTGKIADSAVTTAKVAASAITNAKVADNAITANNISASAVTVDKVADSAITSIKIANAAVIEAKLADSAVTTAKIANSAVTTDKINNLGVTTGKIANAAVTAEKLSGAQTGSAPVYGIRAWVNFNGTSTNELAGSYSRTSSTTVSIATETAHGYLAGQVVYLDFTVTSGSTIPFDGNYVVASVPSPTSFTVISSVSTSSAGTVIVKSIVIRAAGNVHSIIPSYTTSDPSVAPPSANKAPATGYYIMNFLTAMPNTNYIITGGGIVGTTSALTSAEHEIVVNGRAKTTQFAFLGASNVGGTEVNPSIGSVIVIG